ncbi:MAG TPA: hypothetical protein VFM18_20210 [Methanosarcina sp.]|nr:hypothetical protein [Methanosarcina sp.]
MLLFAMSQALAFIKTLRSPMFDNLEERQAQLASVNKSMIEGKQVSEVLTSSLTTVMMEMSSILQIAKSNPGKVTGSKANKCHESLKKSLDAVLLLNHVLELPTPEHEALEDVSEDLPMEIQVDVTLCSAFISRAASDALLGYFSATNGDYTIDEDFLDCLGEMFCGVMILSDLLLIDMEELINMSI